MNWTKQAPTVPDYYWMRPIGRDDEKTLTRIYKIDDDLWCDEFNCEPDRLRDFAAGYEWAGPIPEPGEPFRANEDLPSVSSMKGILKEEHGHDCDERGSKIASDLRAMASQENCDGEPWDTMMKAAEVIDRLECQWFDIATAPKDGSDLFFLTEDEEVIIVDWSGVTNQWEIHDKRYRDCEDDLVFTHWMPIPEGPEGGGK
jgi:hypothetical protein